jgi:hypothetical protein
LKLGDDKADDIGLRQRAPLSRKKSDSNMSTKSAPPVPANSDKEKEHARKKSWFTTYASAIPSAISPTPPSKPTFDPPHISTSSLASASDSALPLQAKHDPTELHHASSSQSLVGRQPSLKRQAASQSPDTHGSYEEGAADRLRGILKSDQSTASRKASISSQSASEVPSIDAKQATDSSLANTSIGIPTTSQMAPPPPSTSSLAPDSTGTVSATQDRPFDVASAYSSDTIGRPTISRKKSDKSISSIQTASSSNSVGGPSSPTSLGPSSSAASTNSNLGQSPTSTTSAILNQWKVKAADKQAIQASVDRGVLQAKDAMNKWSNRWQAYKKQQAERTQGSELGQDDVPSRQYHYHAPEPAPDVFEASTTPPHRSSSPLSHHKDVSSSPPSSHKPRHGETADLRNISASPTSHFIRPSAATAATSLATGEAVAMVPSTVAGGSGSTGHPSSSDTESVRPMKRVPPPSTFPVHPAFSVADKHARRSSTQSKPGYQPAPMMAIPGIEESRRFALGSDDIVGAQTAPALPSRPQVSSSAPDSATAPPLPERQQETHSSQAHSSGSHSESEPLGVGAAAEAPPLPSRPGTEGLAVEALEPSIAVPVVALEPPTPSTAAGL